MIFQYGMNKRKMEWLNNPMQGLYSLLFFAMVNMVYQGK